MPYQDGPYPAPALPPGTIGPVPPGTHRNAQGMIVQNQTCNAHFDARTGQLKPGKRSPIPGTRYGVDIDRGCVYVDLKTGRTLSPLEEAQARALMLQKGVLAGTPQAA